jgi:hypothetical protein
VNLSEAVYNHEMQQQQLQLMNAVMRYNMLWDMNG